MTPKLVERIRTPDDIDGWLAKELGYKKVKAVEMDNCDWTVYVPILDDRVIYCTRLKRQVPERCGK